MYIDYEKILENSSKYPKAMFISALRTAFREIQDLEVEKKLEYDKGYKDGQITLRDFVELLLPNIEGDLSK